MVCSMNVAQFLVNSVYLEETECGKIKKHEVGKVDECEA